MHELAPKRWHVCLVVIGYHNEHIWLSIQMCMYSSSVLETICPPKILTLTFTSVSRCLNEVSRCSNGQTFSIFGTLILWSSPHVMWAFIIFIIIVKAVIFELFLSFFKGGTKLERIRDLFEQALEKCPAKFAKGVSISYKLCCEHI